MEFTLLQEARILYGAGKVQETGALLRRLGVDKALVVCDEGVKKAGIVERVTNSLTQAQVEFALFDKVQADPPSEVVDEGAAFCRAERCGAVIAVGGGSSIDTAKGINLLRCNPGKIMDYAGQKNEMKKAGGLVAVPTTAGRTAWSSPAPNTSNARSWQRTRWRSILFWILCLRWGCRQGLRRPREWMFWHTPWNPTHQRRRLSRQTRSAREIFVRSYNGCLWRCHIRTR